MADEDKTTMDAGDDTTTGGSEAPKKGGNSKLILFGGIGLGAVVIGLVVALFVIKPMLSDSSGDQTEQEYAEETDDGESKDAAKPKPRPKKKKRKKSSSGDGESQSLIYAIRDIVVNPAGTGGSRFLSVSFGFELASPDFESEFAAREAVVRDALITILSSKTVAQLTDAKQKEITRYQIKKRVSKLLDSDELIGVYFTDFVLQ